MGVEADWVKIKTWLTSNAPQILSGLLPGATQEEIAKTEAFLNISFPQEVVESYLICNGQDFDSPALFDGWRLLSLSEIQDCWQFWKDLADEGAFDDWQSELAAGIKGVWWDTKWIPFTSDAGNGNESHCLDLTTNSHSKYGQIILMWHDDSHRPVKAESFGEWLHQFAVDLENGRYICSEEDQSIIERPTRLQKWLSKIL